MEGLVLNFADYAVTMLRRAQEGSQTFLTAISLMVASERRMAADRFTGAVDAEVCRGVQIQFFLPGDWPGQTPGWQQPATVRFLCHSFIVSGL